MMGARQHPVWHVISPDDPDYALSFPLMKDLCDEIASFSVFNNSNLKKFRKTEVFKNYFDGFKPLEFIPIFLNFVKENEKGSFCVEKTVNSHVMVQREIDQLLPIIHHLTETNLRMDRPPQDFKRLKLEIVKVFKNSLIPGLDFFEKQHLADITKQMQSMKPIELVEYGTAAVIMNWAAKYLSIIQISLTKYHIYCKYMLLPEIKEDYRLYFEQQGKDQACKNNSLLYYTFMSIALKNFPKLVHMLGEIISLKDQLEPLRKKMFIIITKTIDSNLDTEEGRQIMRHSFSYAFGSQIQGIINKSEDDNIPDSFQKCKEPNRHDKEKEINSITNPGKPVSEQTADLPSTSANRTNQTDVKEMQLITNPPILESSKTDSETEPVTEPVTTVNKVEFEDFLKEIEQASASESKTKIHETVSKKKSKPKAKRKRKRKSQKVRKLEREKQLLAQIEYDVSDTVDTKQVKGDFSSPSANAAASNMAEWNVQGKVPCSFETSSTKHSAKDAEYSNNDADSTTIKQSDNQSGLKDVPASKHTDDEDENLNVKNHKNCKQPIGNAKTHKNITYNKNKSVNANRNKQFKKLKHNSYEDKTSCTKDNFNQPLLSNDSQKITATENMDNHLSDSASLYYPDADTDNFNHAQSLSEKNKTKNEIILKDDTTTSLEINNDQVVFDTDLLKKSNKNFQYSQNYDTPAESVGTSCETTKFKIDKTKQYDIQSQQVFLEQEQLANIYVPEQSTEISTDSVNEYSDYEPTIVDTEAYKNSPYNIKNDKPVNSISGNHEIYHYEARTSNSFINNYLFESRYPLLFENSTNEQPAFSYLTGNFKNTRYNLFSQDNYGFINMPQRTIQQNVKQQLNNTQQQMFENNHQQYMINSYNQPPIFGTLYPQPYLQNYYQQPFIGSYSQQQTNDETINQYELFEDNNQQKLTEPLHNQQETYDKENQQLSEQNKQQPDQIEETCSKESYEIVGTENIKASCKEKSQLSIVNDQQNQQAIQDALETNKTIESLTESAFENDETLESEVAEESLDLDYKKLLLIDPGEHDEYILYKTEDQDMEFDFHTVNTGEYDEYILYKTEEENAFKYFHLEIIV